MRKQGKFELITLLGLGALALFASNRRSVAALPLFASGVLLMKPVENETSFRGQNAIITGGSRGLGLALARELILQGARVTLLARDAEELARAKVILEKMSANSVHTIACNVTVPEELARAFEEADELHGGIDLLINNAGSILVGPWETMEMQDYEAQMDLHLYAVISATQLALPYLREKGSGKRIVNICSMGGRVPAPHMLPYVTSKFALSGFSQGVAVELDKDGIAVTTIYPTMMQTGSPIQAVFKGDHEKEFAWFQSADVMPFLSETAERAAKKILTASLERRWELTPSFAAKIRMMAAAFVPEILAETMASLNRVLPEGDSKERRTGAQSSGYFENSWLTKPFLGRAHKAEHKLNQKPTDDPEFNMGLGPKLH